MSSIRLETQLFVKCDLLSFILKGPIQAAIGKNNEIQLVKTIKLETKGGDKIDSRILVSNGISCLCSVN